MRRCLIVNPNAGSADDIAALEETLERDDWTYWETNEPGDARRLAHEAVEDGFTLVVAGGGDGTINEVVNGILNGGGSATLGILPIGTGNDLVRTLGYPEDPRDAFAVLCAEEPETVLLDLIKVESPSLQAPRFAINAAAGGFSGQINEVLTPELKKTWGPLAFLIGSVQALPELHDYTLRISYDGGPQETDLAFNVVVANGRTIGGGKLVAPMADPTDGWLDVLHIRKGPLGQMSEAAARFVAGSWHESELVTHRRVRSLRVEAEPGMWFNVDGELLTNEPITFTLVPHALRVAVGPDFAASRPD